MPRITQFTPRRGTAAAWTSANPVLAAGELGFETDTMKFKMGDGTAAWASLAYWASTPTVQLTQAQYNALATKNAATLYVIVG